MAVLMVAPNTAAAALTAAASAGQTAGGSPVAVQILGRTAPALARPTSDWAPQSVGTDGAVDHPCSRLPWPVGMTGCISGTVDRNPPQ